MSEIISQRIEGEYLITTYDSGHIIKEINQTEEMKAQQALEQATQRFYSTREGLFTSTAWVRERHNDRVELGINDSVNWTDWLTYWQELREMPEQEGFDILNPVYPEQPE